MTTIIITGVQQDPDSDFPDGTNVRATLLTAFLFSGGSFINQHQISTAVSDSDGTFSLTLQVPDAATQAARYHFRLPDNQTFYSGVDQGSATDWETFVAAAADTDTFSANTLAGYMTKAVYDPQPVAGDAFNLALHTDNIADSSVPETAVTQYQAAMISDTAYGAGWNGDLDGATKNVLYAKIETLGGLEVTIDTRDNLLATTPTADAIGFSSDTKRYYVFILADSAWYESPINYGIRSGVDMGYEKDSSTAGYGLTYISNKDIANCRIGSNDRNVERAIRVVNSSPPTFEIYMDGAWHTILYDFTMESGDLQHTPFSSTEEIRVLSGNSVSVGLNGRPDVQGYKRSMGAFPPPVKIFGGTY